MTTARPPALPTNLPTATVPPPGEEPRPTLADFFRPELDALARSGEATRRMVAQMKESAKTVKIVPATLGDKVYEQVFATVFQQLGKFVAIDLPKDVLAAAWSKYSELQEYLDREKYPADVLSKVVLLLEQQIEAKHAPSVQPVVEILGKQIELAKITFPIRMAMKVKGGGVGVKDGKIVHLSVAECLLNAELGCGYGDMFTIPLAKKEAPVLGDRLFRFAEGVPIRPRGGTVRPAAR